MTIYANVDKAVLTAAMASWKSNNAAAAFESCFDTYVDSVSWTDAYCASVDSSAYNYENATWTNAMEASMDADEKFAYGMGY